MDKMARKATGRLRMSASALTSAAIGASVWMATACTMVTGGGGGLGAPQCPAPKAKLSVQVTAQECMACNRLAIFAQSPQITAAIARGHSPCSSGVGPTGNPPPGCVIDTVFVDTFADCGGTSCGPYSVDLADEFLPAISGAEPAITDTVAFCPFDFDGTSFTPAGNCASSFSQCDPSATITLDVNGIYTPPADAGGGG